LFCRFSGVETTSRARLGAKCVELLFKPTAPLDTDNNNPTIVAIGEATDAILAICQHVRDHWHRYCHYFHSDLAYRIAYALEPFSYHAP
jgi:hypothetical protein